MKKSVIFFFFSSFLMAGIKPANAHAVYVDFNIKSPFVNVKAYFSKNSPMANSDVTIFPPGSDTPFQKGVTDLQGNFVFMPNRAGTWKVIADDGLGHKRTAEIVINESFFSDEENRVIDDTQQHLQDEHEGYDSQSKTHPDHNHEHIHSKIPVFYKVIFGLSLIFGISGIFYGLKKRNS